VSLSPGQLVLTRVSESWRSTKYYSRSTESWTDIVPGTPCIITGVDWKNITFMSGGSLYSMHNCYDDESGIPVWCSPV